MDIFKQKRYLGMIIILLVVLNLGTITMLWLGKPSARPPFANRKNPVMEKNRIQHILKDELGFDHDQAEKFLQLRHEQMETVRKLNQQIQETKRQMFDEVLKDNPRPTLSDSLLKITQDKQAQIERQTYNYFLDIKKLCNPEQSKKLQILMHDIFIPHPPVNEPGRISVPPPDNFGP